MKAHLEASAQLAAKRLSGKNPPDEEYLERVDGRRSEAAAPEEAAAHSSKMARDENAPAVPSDTRHERRAPRRTPARSAAQAESSRLNCARGVWRYAAGYWFL